MLDNDSLSYALGAIKTEQFAIFEEHFSQKKEINLNSELTFRLNREERRIGVFLTISFKQAKKTFIKLQTSCHFIIAPESWELIKKENSITLPKQFLLYLTMLSVGTSRGVLHSKTEGTGFNKYILPLFDATKLVPEDITFTDE